MFKPETSAYSPTGYSWIPQEKFGIRPQFLGLYQSNPMLNDQRNVLTNANQIHALHHSSSLSPDVTNTEDTSTNKLYSKKRHGTVTNKKNISVPTSFVCSRTPANNDYNSSMKGESFKAPMSKGYAYNHKRFGSRVASRENIQEPSPMKASNGRSSHTCDYNSMSNSRESNKYGISSVKNKERVHFQSDTPNQTSQTQSVSITSTRCLQGEEGKSKFVETEPNHTPQADDSYSEKNETYETVKKNIHMMQHFTKVNTLQNPIYPSIISHKNENLNISASLLNSANKNTPNKAANACSLSNTRNTTVQKSHQLRNTDEVTGSFDQHVNHENVSFSESIAGNQPQSVHSQVIQKQKTQQRHTLPNSNSATSSLSAGDDRAFCDSGISSSSYSKDNWVFNRTPCNKRPLHDQSPHQELNQESLSKIPSFSKQSDTSKNYNSTRIVDSEPSFSITQRPQRPRTIGKLISQTGNGVISLIPQTCEQDLQVPQKAIHDSYIPTVSFAKANLEVISPNKVLQSFRHSDEHSANTPDSPLVPTNTMVAKRPNKILVDPNKSKVKGAETEVTSTTNMFSTNTSSSINNTDTSRYNENSSNLNNLRSRVHLMSEPPKLIERLGHIQCDQRNQTPVGNTLNNRRQQNHHQQHQHVAGQAIDQRFKNKSNHLSFDSECENGRVKRDSGKSTILNNEQSMKIRFTQFTQHPDNSESDNKATLAHQQLSGSVISEVSNSVEKIPTTSNPIDFRKISENLEKPFLWKSLSGQVTENPYDKPPDITSDPDILLSSLSKLSCDPCLEDNSWDQNYFSDVESEYAALELILPTTKRESLTEAEIALELDRKLSENTACSTGPLSQVKLPYPTISLTANMGSLEDITVKSGISSFAVRRRGTFATVFNSDHYKMKMRLLTGEINGMISVINPSTSKSSNLLIENFRQETKRLRDGLSVLSAQLSLKDNAIEALEDNLWITKEFRDT
ncbi:unnamed protein product [Heterobilharzia americana]|nr:unnamed protein product [Heterobilharzia americana]